MTASTATHTYRCPGETYDISRGVHLARLAANYSKCRTCPHNESVDGGADSPEPAIGDVAPPAVVPDQSLFVEEGVRGVYLNQLNRTLAGNIAGAFASCLWDDLPSDGDGTLSADRSSSCGRSTVTGGEGITLLAPGRPGPMVVLANDERASSPDIVAGTALALRRMGCQVVDIGATTAPGFSFAVYHLQAAGGVLVTGSGFDPAWTGLEFVGRGVVPCSRGGMLNRIRERVELGYVRPSRRPGSQRSFPSPPAYEAGLWKHFHALRPLRIAFACPGPAVRRLFFRLFHKLSCRLIPVEAPVRRRRLDDPANPDLLRTTAAVREQAAHFGVFVEEDGRQCVFFDETGARVPGDALLDLLVEAFQEESPKTVVVREPPEPTLEAVAREMQATGAALGGGDSGWFWFRESFPVCDAVLTVAHLLQALSRSDAPFSEAIRRAQSEH